MTHLPHAAEELTRIYHSRFEGQAEYRMAVWRVLIDTIFAPWVHADARVLDLGAGRGEFINQIRAFQKFAMDLNPATAETLAPSVRFLEQDCSATWPIEHGSLDLIFYEQFLRASAGQEDPEINP
jgi:SAM-dependent methyltransferase